MSQLTFQLDENSEKAIEELKEFFSTRLEMLRRAVLKL